MATTWLPLRRCGGWERALTRHGVQISVWRQRLGSIAAPQPWRACCPQSKTSCGRSRAREASVSIFCTPPSSCSFRLQRSVPFPGPWHRLSLPPAAAVTVSRASQTHHKSFHAKPHSLNLSQNVMYSIESESSLCRKESKKSPPIKSIGSAASYRARRHTLQPRHGCGGGNSNPAAEPEQPHYESLYAAIRALCTRVFSPISWIGHVRRHAVTEIEQCFSDLGPPLVEHPVMTNAVKHDGFRAQVLGQFHASFLVDQTIFPEADDRAWRAVGLG